MSGVVNENDDFLFELAQEYAEQLTEILSDVETNVVELGRTGVAQPKLFRDVHSMKGAGASFGLPIISTICHQFEDQLALLTPGEIPSPDKIDRFLKYIDLVRSAQEVVLDKSLDMPARNERFNHLMDDLHELMGKGLIHILVADMSRSMVSMITKVLEGLPVAILAVSDGHTALTRALTEPFDLIVVSGQLKQIDGCGVIAALKLSGRPQIPMCVLLTSDITEKRGKACGADHVFPKTPVGLDQLRQLMVEFRKAAA